MFPVSKSIIAVILVLFFIGCAGTKQGPQPEPVTTPEATLPPEFDLSGETTQASEIEPGQPSPETAEPPREKPNPRALASLELSKQAELLIEAGRLDEAIRTLEQAVNLHPGSGEGYYYLAEAWRLKGNAAQASEFNTLAAIRFRDDPEWMFRIDVQKDRIERMR